VVKKYTIENLAKRPIDFRDKTVLSFKAEDAVSLTIDRKKDKESVALAKKGNDWLGNGKKVKDPGKIKTALEALATLKAEGFAAASAKELGLDKPDWTVEVQLKDRTRHLLSVGSVEKDGFLGLSRRGVSYLFSFRKYSLDRFLLDPKSFK
jgi:hypothetical protein